MNQGIAVLVKVHRRQGGIINPLAILLLALNVYLVSIGGTWRAVSDPALSLVNMLLVAVIFVVWLVARQKTLVGNNEDRHGYRLSAQVSIPAAAWLVALLLSSAANWANRQVIFVGTAHLVGYAVYWVVLQDCLHEQLIQVTTVIQVWLIGSAVAVIQVLLSLVISGGRLSGWLENPNILASYLLLLLPLCLILQQADQRPVVRAAQAYFMALVGLLALTLSRGGILGAVVALAFIAQSRSFGRPYRKLALIALVALVLVLVVMPFLRLDAQLTRLDNGRLPIYAAAIQDFLSHPLTGTGLFTFRTPPDRSLVVAAAGQNVHAHNIVLHVAAELGLPGLIALFLTVFMFLRKLRIESSTQFLALAGIVGIAVHQMVDVTLITPTVGLGFLTLAALVQHPDA